MGIQSLEMNGASVQSESIRFRPHSEESPVASLWTVRINFGPYEAQTVPGKQLVCLGGLAKKKPKLTEKRSWRTGTFVSHLTNLTTAIFVPYRV